MARWVNAGIVVALGLGIVPGIVPVRAGAQTFERDTTITGPRGRSIQRQVDITRTPGGVERDISIKRPGGTFQRETFLPRPGGPAFGPRGGWGWGPPRGPVFIGGGGGGGGLSPLGAGLLGGALGTGAGLLLGSAIAQPRPAPVVVQQPVVVAQPAPTVGYVPPVRYQQAPAVAAQPTTVIDPVAQEVSRFQSMHEASRVDAAAHLGRMGDARAVSPLVDRLKNDKSKDVRVAAATALGEIGAPDATIYLERSVIYDKKQEVRDASTLALNKIRQVQAQLQAQTAAALSRPSLNGFSPAPTQSAQVPSLSPIESVPPPPAPANLAR